MACLEVASAAQDPFALRGIAPLKFLGDEISSITKSARSAGAQVDQGHWQDAVETLEQAQRDLESMRLRVGEGKAALRKFREAEDELAEQTHALAAAWMIHEAGAVVEGSSIAHPSDLLDPVRRRLTDVVAAEMAGLLPATSVEIEGDQGSSPVSFQFDASLVAMLSNTWREDEQGNSRKLLWLGLVAPDATALTVDDIAHYQTDANDADTSYLAGLSLTAIKNHPDPSAESQTLTMAGRYFAHAMDAGDAAVAREADTLARLANRRMLAMALDTVTVDEKFWVDWDAALNPTGQTMPLAAIEKALPLLGMIPSGLLADPPEAAEGGNGLLREAGAALMSDLKPDRALDADLLVGWVCSGRGLQEWARAHLEQAWLAQGLSAARRIRISYVLGRAVEDTCLPAPLSDERVYSSAAATASNRERTEWLTRPLDETLADVNRFYTSAIEAAKDDQVWPADIVHQLDYMSRWLYAHKLLREIDPPARRTTGYMVRTAIQATRTCGESVGIRLRATELLRSPWMSLRDWDRLTVLAYGSAQGVDGQPPSNTFYEIGTDNNASLEVARLAQTIGLAQFFDGVSYGNRPPLRIDSLKGDLDARFLRAEFLSVAPYSTLPDLIRDTADWGVVIRALDASSRGSARAARDVSHPSRAAYALDARGRQFAANGRHVLAARAYLKSYMLVPTTAVARHIGQELREIHGTTAKEGN